MEWGEAGGVLGVDVGAQVDEELCCLHLVLGGGVVEGGLAEVVASFEELGICFDGRLDGGVVSVSGKVVDAGGAAGEEEEGQNEKSVQHGHRL